jgi:hypothetical protein
MIRTLRTPRRVAVLALAITSAVAGFGTGTAHAVTANVECDTGVGTVAVKPAMLNQPVRAHKAKVKVTASLTGCVGKRPDIVSGDVKISLTYPTNQCASIISDAFRSQIPPAGQGPVKVIWRNGKGQKVATSNATSAIAAEDASVSNFVVLSITPTTGPFRTTLTLGVQEPGRNLVRTSCASSGFSGFTGSAGVIS